MKKFLHSLLILFMGVNAVAFAGQSGPHTWDGSNKTLTLKVDTAVTFSYKATESGMLYIYTDNQGMNDNVSLTIEGGWYHDGDYDAEAPLQGVEPYGNGLGFYSWIKVFADDEIRFTISTPKEAAGTMTRFTLKSAFFNQSIGGDSWERPIALNKDQEVTIPVYENYSSELLDSWVKNATYCRFVAPSDGVASIFTEEYLIYYTEEETYGNVDSPLQYASQDFVTNDHEFVVKKDKAYIVIVPNSRPVNLTFKMSYDRLGVSERFPIEITEFPINLDLVKGNNFYTFSRDLIGENTTMEIAAEAGWNGTITYYEGISMSGEFSTDKVAGEAVTFCKNVDPRYLTDDVVVNFNVEDKATAKASLTLRAPKEGESFDTAIKAVLGENAFNGPARHYWFAYTAEAEGVLSFASSAFIKHVNFDAGSEQKVGENKYRVDKGDTVYVCVSALVEGDHTFTITRQDIVLGDYCDKPIVFNLGEDVVIKDRGDGADNYRLFTAKEAGFAIFTTTANWTTIFRGECGGRSLNCQRTVTEESDVVTYTYKLAVEAGMSYILDVTSYANEGADVIYTSAFEGATLGDVCSTAIPIETLGDTLDLAYEFGVEKWHKVVAEKTGFYVIYAKLGYAANMKTKIGDCDAAETNSSSDNNHKNAYMGGYKAAKVYVEEGQTLYIYTKTGSENNEEEFGAGFYLLATFVEARPGEHVNIAIQATLATEYDVLDNIDGYEMWYTYTIPANEELTVSIKATKTFYSGLSFYREDKTTSMSKWKGDFEQEDLTNEKEETIGKQYTFAATDTERVIYVKVPMVAQKFLPVVWKMTNGNDTSIEHSEATTQTPAVIYDLLGRRVDNPTKGIYIINGVKRVIK